MFGYKVIFRFLFGLLFIFWTSLVIASEEFTCSPYEALDSDIKRQNNSDYFKKRITAADNLRWAAALAGVEWLETEGLLTHAREQAGKDNWSLALQLVQKACLQAELALQQAEYESKSWKNRVVK